jgi:superfamily II DNA/RNA helicase
VWSAWQGLTSEQAVSLTAGNKTISGDLTVDGLLLLKTNVLYDEENIDDNTLYSNCCKKVCCKLCLNNWYNNSYRKSCPVCNTYDVTLFDFRTKKKHDEILEYIKNDYKYIKKSKIDFLEYFIYCKIINHTFNTKLIIFSDYINSFIEIKELFNRFKIKYTQFDGGNISEIESQLLNFKNGDSNVLMCNSLLFGCGMNLEFGTDIIFFHKMTDEMEKQVIGRCQRPGRKYKLNIWYLMHENEKEYSIKKIDNLNKFPVEVNNNLSINDIINSYNFDDNFINSDDSSYTII